MSDPREDALKRGLWQLSKKQLKLLIDWLELEMPVLLDRDEHGCANYSNATYCPLAIALGLPGLYAASGRMPTDPAITRYLEKQGLEINNTRGVVGEFFTTSRREDLLKASREVLNMKQILRSHELS